ncbi:MAG: chromosome condensation protein CrcB [Deltaproteobacteria bacterium RIFOXYA12_FULL_58_15]|nr:MAG: chromosome condensation protein CrcB [Deltaproteobacteria bacterium RIFOXYA12_FULL_58_15]
MALMAVAGACGTLARYGVSELVQRFNTTAFPLGTAVVNIIGCFSAGLLWSLFESRWSIAPETRMIIMVGFMGAFTTFSAFILQTSELVRAQEWLMAIGNVTLQNGVGFAALFVGAALGRSFAGLPGFPA